MKKLTALFLILLMLLSFYGCQSQPPTNEEHSKVTVNMPTDDTVNGYRDPDKAVNTNSKIEVTDITVVDESYYLYCGNKSSKKFHSDGCSSIKTIKEENRYYTNKRDKLIKEGYSPCQKCKP